MQRRRHAQPCGIDRLDRSVVAVDDPERLAVGLERDCERIVADSTLATVRRDEVSMTRTAFAPRIGDIETIAAGRQERRARLFTRGNLGPGVTGREIDGRDVVSETVRRVGDARRFAAARNAHEEIQMLEPRPIAGARVDADDVQARGQRGIRAQARRDRPRPPARTVSLPRERFKCRPAGSDACQVRSTALVTRAVGELRNSTASAHRERARGSSARLRVEPRLRGKLRRDCANDGGAASGEPAQRGFGEGPST